MPKRKHGKTDRQHRKPSGALGKPNRKLRKTNRRPNMKRTVRDSHAKEGTLRTTHVRLKKASGRLYVKVTSG